MTVSRTRVRAIVRKELREYRRTRAVIMTMAIFPLVFVIQPLVAILLTTTADAHQLSQLHLLLYMLGIPALVPATVAAVSVVGQRQQGTLEPLLATPLRRRELVAGKALAPVIPAIVVSYAVYAFVLACTALFARPGVAPALIHGPDVAAQLLFTPPVAGLSIWMGIAISARSSDIRVAQQLSALASLPSVLVSSLIAFDVIHATLALAIFLTAVLAIANRLGWRMVSAALDRERLVTGAR